MRTLATGGGEPTSHGPEEDALWHVSILVSGGGAGHIGIDFIFHCDLSAGPGGYRSCIPLTRSCMSVGAGVLEVQVARAPSPKAEQLLCVVGPMMLSPVLRETYSILVRFHRGPHHFPVPHGPGAASAYAAAYLEDVIIHDNTRAEHV